jgi:DNA polymerase-4
MLDVVHSKISVHVSVEGFFQPSRRHELDALVSLTERLDCQLERHATGWSKPSADEAVYEGRPPWGIRSAPMDWASILREDLHRSLTLDVSIGIAATRLTARICSRLARPRGILLWLSGYEDSLVSGMPLEELEELAPPQLARLRAQGIRTLGEVAKLEPGDVNELLGTQGQKLVALVRASESERADSRLSESVRRLARRLSRRLTISAHRARGLELRLAFDDGSVVERYTLLPQAASSPDELCAAARRLAGMVPRQKGAVANLALTATGLCGVFGQLPLFGSSQPREVSVRMGRSSI